VSGYLPEKLVEPLKRKGLADSTQDTYGKILTRGNVERSEPEAILAWIRGEAEDAPIGTVLPLRAAVKHWLVEVVGMSPEDANDVLPPAKGKPGRLREALGPVQLDTYTAEVERLPAGPVRTVLLLLPKTGLRISEACNLRQDEITVFGGRRGLLFRGKGGGQRFVPLTSSAMEILDAHLAATRGRKGADVWAFPGYGGHALTPAAVRKVTRALRISHPELGRLSPHVLRHTWATNALRNLMDIKSVQAILGHKSIQTTSIYLHPTADSLADAMERAERGVDGPRPTP
jgi:integrase